MRFRVVTSNKVPNSMTFVDIEADSVEINKNNALCFWKDDDVEDVMVAAFNTGQWILYRQLGKHEVSPP